MEPEAQAGPLAGQLIALPEARELDLFCGLLERRGATVLRAPLVAIHDAQDPAPVLAWLEAFAAGSCDDLILLTGEGLRRLLACLERHAPALRPAFIAALGRARRITRGPKPARAVRELGLPPDLEAATPTSAGVLELLAGQRMGGRRVGLQLYGEEPNRPLVAGLEAMGATVLPVAPYRYADASEDRAVQELIAALASGRVAAIAFTSQAQVQRLFNAGVAGVDVAAALSAIQVAAVGPVVGEALRARGVRVDAMPGSSWFMKPLANELVRLLGSQPGRQTGDQA
jgi:uroporphyrinogen-III synthase